MSEPIRYAPTIPMIEPTAAPIRVFRVARRILSSNRIMQTAIMAPTAAEIHGFPATGLSTYPADTRIPVKISRMIMTSACMMEGILSRRERDSHQKPLTNKRFRLLSYRIGLDNAERGTANQDWFGQLPPRFT